MVTEDKKLHLNVLKSLTFFGSLQIVQTLFSLIKAKYVSILLGPSGLGLITLYSTFLNTIVYVVGFGLFNSAVRNISIANGIDDKKEIQSIFNLVTKIIVITSIIASGIMILFKSQINFFFFNNTIENRYSIIYLVLFVFLSVLANRNNMLIQGMGKYKEFGKSSLISSGIILLAVFPIFYFYGKDGIISSLIISAFIIYLTSAYFKKSLNIQTSFDFNFKQLYSNSSHLIKLGTVMMFSSLLGNIVSNFINIYIVKNGSSYDLGLYNAAVTISLQFVSLVFVSLSSEFYPRLSSISHDYAEVSIMVNRQIEVILVVLFPLLILMQIFAPIMVKTIFTKEFGLIIPFIQVATIAIVFQALAYVISNIPMAMGSKKILFLYNSFLPGIISLIFSLLGYRLFGLMGLVYAFFVVNIFHFFTMYFVVRRKYNFLIQNNILKLIYIILLTLTLSLFVVLIAEGIVYYALIVLFVILISFITYYKSSQIFGFNFRDIWKYVRAEI